MANDPTARDDVLRTLRSNGGAATNDDWRRITADIEGADDALKLLLEQGVVFRDQNGNLRMRRSGVQSIELR